jgi:hypothetical protein
MGDETFARVEESGMKIFGERAFKFHVRIARNDRKLINTLAFHNAFQLLIETNGETENRNTAIIIIIIRKQVINNNTRNREIEISVLHTWLIEIARRDVTTDG